MSKSNKPLSVGIGPWTGTVLETVSKGPFAVSWNWLPSDLYGQMAMWIDANDSSTITQSGGTVSQITDKSGFGNKTTQGTVGQQPAYQATGLNSKSTMSFVSANSSTLTGASATTLVSTSGYSAFAVAQVASIAAVQTIVAQDSASARDAQFLRTNTSGQVESIAFNTSSTAFTAAAGTVTVNTPFIAGSVSTGTSGTVTAYLNGTAGTPVAITGIENTLASTFSLGATTRASPVYSDIKISEVVIVAGVVTTAQRQQIEGYLAWKWGLQALLPGGHPYVAAAPTFTYSYMSFAKVIQSAGNYLQDNIYATPFGSYSGSILCGLMSPNRLPMIGKSTDAGATWTTNFVGAIPVGEDAHNVTTIGIDPNGFIHVCPGMHDEPLKYWRSNSAGDISAFTSIGTMTGSNENLVTYMQFFNSPVTGKLYAVYYNGQLTTTKIYILLYNEGAQTWSLFATLLDSAATGFGPFVENISFDSSDNIFVTWTWRTGSGSPTNTQNYYYMKYDRAAGQWKDISGNVLVPPVAYGSLAATITTQARLINHCTQFVDSNGNLHLAWLKNDGNSRTQVWHTSIVGTTVTTTQVSNLSEAIVNANWPDLSRPLIWVYNGTLYILFTNGGTSSAGNFANPPGQAYLATSTDGLTGAAWSVRAINTGMQCSEFNIDYTALAGGTIRIFGQETEAQIGPSYMFGPQLLSA